MITVGQIYDDLNDLAPFDTAEAFDNAGLLLGERRTEVKKAGVCLDTVSYTHLDVYKRQGPDAVQPFFGGGGKRPHCDSRLPVRRPANVGHGDF